MFGKKIEKSIRYSEGTDTYHVQFTFNSKEESHIRSFPTLEDARAYRDAINAAKLEYKIKRDTAIINNKLQEELADSNYNPYPYNLLKAIGIKDIHASIDVVNNFETILEEACNEQEIKLIKYIYLDKKTLSQIGKEEGYTGERIRQIAAKGIKKLRRKLYYYDIDQKEKADAENKDKYRRELVEEFKRTGIISVELKKEFGVALDEDEKTIDDLDLSVRTYNCLRKAGIYYLKDFNKYTIDDLSRIKNMGKKSFNEIFMALKWENIKIKGDLGE